MAAEDSAPRYLSPETLSTPGGHYSHACVANGMVYISGQLPIRPDGTLMGDAPFPAQARQALDNVAAALAAAGSGIGRLVQVRVYIDSVDNWPAFNTVYAEWAGTARPARAIVPTGPLHYGFKVEVEAVALAAPGT
ncbi:RidA family protein [Bordetella sp. BOR01]|uniref:RidA family protein n=1 Tax=Bordetella sp. BOR01 TaxID=2854779 RepID=UPI001C4842F8|nr:RidA family protein [Bordetella sp. BOR01]MBV7483655.1 RidA family protein [Bordetella sp. BOR01]